MDALVRPGKPQIRFRTGVLPPTKSKVILRLQPREAAPGHLTEAGKPRPQAWAALLASLFSAKLSTGLNIHQGLVQVHSLGS